MRSLLALLALAAMVLLAACGTEEEGTDTSTPSSTPADDKAGSDSGPAMDATDDAANAAGDATAAAQIEYACGCGKTKTLGADVPPPS